jgi:hypothetical protein
MRIFAQQEPLTDAELAVQVIHAVLGCAENGDVVYLPTAPPVLSAVSRIILVAVLSKSEPRGPVLSRPAKFI